MNLDLLKPFFIKDRPFTIKEFAEFYSLRTQRASFILSRLSKQNHLAHLKRGVYFPVSHKGLSPEESLGDPFLVVSIVFPNSCVGGWSMANYWGLTEQIFKSVVVLTDKTVHKSHKIIGRYNFYLFKAHLPLSIGITSIWNENQEISVSDIHRTIIDMIENPACGGGIQNTLDCAKSYFNDSYDPKIFLEYAMQVRNGVFFKRLGFISERIFGINHPLCAISKQRMSRGNSPIDSHVPCKKLVTRWNLFINMDLEL